MVTDFSSFTSASQLMDFDFGISMAQKPGNRLSTLSTLSMDSNLSKPLAPKASSSYWRVPDDSQYLTSVAVHPMDNLCAVASGGRKNNLFIYELSAPASPEPMLTHHQTISLPQIHSLEWVSPNTPLGSQGNVLVSGHKDGLVHMTLLPDTHSSDIPAEILKRFNHQHHITANTATRIQQLKLTSLGWTCSVPASIATLCAEHMFLWNPTRSDVPILKQKARGVTCFDLCDHRDGIVAMGGRKGIAIRDIRTKGSNGLSPPNDNDTAVSQVRWSPTDENVVAAVHDGSTIKVWDIRSSGPLCSYEGHSDKVTSVEWSNLRNSHLVSSSEDGTIRVWSIEEAKRSNHSGQFKDSKALKTSRSISGDWSATKNWRMYQNRQIKDYKENILALDLLNGDESLPMVSQNKQFVSMRLSGNDAVSIDNDGYFGFHRLNAEPMSPLSSASESSDTDFLPPFSSLDI